MSHYIPKPKSKYARASDFWQSETIDRYQYLLNSDEIRSIDTFRELNLLNLHKRTTEEILEILTTGSQNLDLDNETGEKWVTLLGLDCHRIFGNFDLFFDMVATFGKPYVYGGGY